MSVYGWTPYVPVVERRRKALRELEKRKKQGHAVSPVSIAGRAIATTFWGKAWCENLEGYSDYANRLPRARTYVRNGSVVDLQITPGTIQALVSGSALYKVSLKVAPVAKAHWKSICNDCWGAIDSLVELLQGRLSKGVMERICRQKQGLFLRRLRSSFRAVARIGRTCASMSRRCCMASARGSITNLSCCSVCVVWMSWSCSPARARRRHSGSRRRPPAGDSEARTSPRCSASTSRRAPVSRRVQPSANRLSQSARRRRQ